MSSRKLNSGFTLVELSIVIIIIGFLIAGVAAGTSLIESAKLSSTISSIEKITTASNAFYSRYNYNAGDLPTASSYWSTGCTTSISPTACNGNGNGLIGANEDYLAPVHLKLSGIYPSSIQPVPFALLGLSASIQGSFEVAQVKSGSSGSSGISGPGGGKDTKSNVTPVVGVNYLSTAFNGVGITFAEPSGAFGFKSGSAGMYLAKYNGSQFAGPAFSSLNASNIDNKIDDGKPLAGRIRSFRGSAAITGLLPQGCLNLDANNEAVYDLTDSRTLYCKLGTVFKDVVTDEAIIAALKGAL